MASKATGLGILAALVSFSGSSRGAGAAPAATARPRRRDDQRAGRGLRAIALARGDELHGERRIHSPGRCGRVGGDRGPADEPSWLPRAVLDGHLHADLLRDATSPSPRTQRPCTAGGRHGRHREHHRVDQQHRHRPHPISATETISDWMCLPPLVINGDPYISLTGTFSFMNGRPPPSSTWGSTAGSSGARRRPRAARSTSTPTSTATGRVAPPGRSAATRLTSRTRREVPGEEDGRPGRPLLPGCLRAVRGHPGRAERRRPRLRPPRPPGVVAGRGAHARVITSSSPDQRTPFTLGHELVHVRQQAASPARFWWTYLTSPRARLLFEAEAYAVHARAGCPVDGDHGLAAYLSGPAYLWTGSRAEAQEAIQSFR